MNAVAPVPDFHQKSDHPRDPHDFYIEPEWAVDALLSAEPFHGTTLDPAAGSGTIPRVMQRRGYHCVGSDIADRGQSFRGDFLNDPPALRQPDNIVCNPPYRSAGKFIPHALAIAKRKVAMLVQQQFPYSQTRHGLFVGTPLARIYFLSDRPSMPPGDLLLAGKIKATGGKTDYLWMVWDRLHVGSPTCHWLRRPAQ